MANPSCGTTWPFHEDLQELPYLYAVNGCSIFLAACGNALLIMAMRRTTINNQNAMVVMTVLALSDLLLGIIVLPLFIVILSNATGKYCDLERAAQFLGLAFGANSGNSLFIVSLDRFFMMCHPKFYLGWITPSRVKLALLASFIISIAVACSPFVFTPYITFLMLVTAIFTYFTITSCCYATIIITVRRHLRKVTATSPKQQDALDSKFDVEVELRAVWTLIILLIAKLICYLPFGIAALVWSRQKFYLYKEVSVLLRRIYLGTLSLAYLHSGINPFIFIIRNCTIRKEAERLLRMQLR